MYHQTINAFTTLIMAATILSCTLSSLTDACSPKVKSEVTTPKPRPPAGVFRFRREGTMNEEEKEEEDSSTSAQALIMVDELVRVLEQDGEEEVSVIEWSLEGHSVEDFWKLLNIYDRDGNDRISRAEIAQVQTS